MDSQEAPNQPNFYNKYTISHKIGFGTFGEIYLAYHKRTREKVAVKIEKINEADPSHSTLTREIKVLQVLKGEKGFPKLYYYARLEKERIMVLNLLGKNLHQLYKSCGKIFSLKTVLMLAEQMLSRFEIFHSKGYVHRDIKPENFLIGNHKDTKTVYLIDFGLSKKFIDNNGAHIPMVANIGLVGTARYTSINSHHGLEQSRRDDLESLGYLLVYFLKGKLPWMNTTGLTREEKHEKILKIKEGTKIEDLCDGLPKEFVDYFHYVKELAFNETPNYSNLKKMFRTLYAESNYSTDADFDWSTPKDNSLLNISKESDMNGDGRHLMKRNSDTKINLSAIGSNASDMKIMGLTHLNVSNLEIDMKFDEVDYEEQIEENLYFIEDKGEKGSKSQSSGSSKKHFTFSLIEEKMPKSLTNIKGIDSLNKRIGSRDDESNFKSGSRSNGGSGNSHPSSFNGSSGKIQDHVAEDYFDTDIEENLEIKNKLVGLKTHQFQTLAKTGFSAAQKKKL